jgi:hypothetical protein
VAGAVEEIPEEAAAATTGGRMAGGAAVERGIYYLAPRRRATAPRYLGISFCFSWLQNKS